MNDDGLTDQEKAILDFEGTGFWIHQGAKEDEIRRRFDLSATRYYQRLLALIRRDEALIYAPVTVKRLRRLSRSGGGGGGPPPRGGGPKLPRSPPAARSSMCACQKAAPAATTCPPRNCRTAPPGTTAPAA